MNFFDSIRSGFLRYFDFDGRSSRSEFWYFTLFMIIIYLVSAIIDEIMGLGGVVYIIADLALLIPSYSVGARRLHDINYSGWWQLFVVPTELLAFINYDINDHGILVSLYTIVVLIIFIILFSIAGHRGKNDYGNNPLEKPYVSTSNTRIVSRPTETKKVSSSRSEPFATTTVSSSEDYAPHYSSDSETTQFTGVKSKEKNKTIKSSKDLVDNGFKVVRKTKDH